MNQFMNEDFLLDTETARRLYHSHAAKMPIYDYHNHLSAREIYENKCMDNITAAWLGFDHYKWRSMRWNGISEKYITGDSSDYDKFQKWAETMPYLFGNPLYHWTHLELRRYFDMEETLNSETAAEIYEHCNRLLQSEDFRIRRLIEKNNVHALVTTDDPCDDLYYHRKLREEGFSAKVLPGFRPDAAIHIEKPGFPAFIRELEAACNKSLPDYPSLIQALISRIEYFHEAGCRIADHGLDQMLYAPADAARLNEIYEKALKGILLTREEVSCYQGGIQTAMAEEYRKRNWVMQLHIGPLRDTSGRLLASYGPNAGGDSANDDALAAPLSSFLNALDQENKLPKTVLYNLNPKDNATIAILAGSFQDGSIPGKIQFGPAWWFNDTSEGMRAHIHCLSSLGLLSRFIGMLTDSRSFLSFPRHEYFRRLLCSEIGRTVENGEYPTDMKFLGKMVEDICFNNAKSYFEG